SGPIRASAAAVVKSLVFEAGVKSLSAFCEYNVFPVVMPDVVPDVLSDDSETTSIPQKPRARSGALSTSAIRSDNGRTCKDWPGAASRLATSRRSRGTKGLADRRRSVHWMEICKKEI